VTFAFHRVHPSKPVYSGEKAFQNPRTGTKVQRDTDEDTGSRLPRREAWHR